MRLFCMPRFTLSLSGTHALRSLLCSLRHVLPSEGVAVSVFLHFIARGKAHTGPGSSPTRAPYAALQEKTSPPPLRRLSIRPVAQTDGSFGQTSLQGPETSGNVLNRSLRCFLPCAAIEPGEGAYRPRDKHAGAGDSAPAGGEEPFGLFWAFRLHDDFIERVLVSLFLILTLLN